MPEQLLKTGAKKITDGTASPISCDANGAIISQRKFDGVSTKLWSGVLSDTGNKTIARTSIADKGLISLRVFNAAGVPLKLIFYTDDGTHNSGGLFGLDGQNIYVVIPWSGASRSYIITPQDIPCLNYMISLRMGISAMEGPTGENETEVYLVTKT